MKQSKPRNYVALALMKRNGAGAHDKTGKAKRAEAKRHLIKEIKKPSKTDGFFIGKLVDYLYQISSLTMESRLPRFARNDRVDFARNDSNSARNNKRFIQLNKYASQILI